jgi:hypothetical protein
MSFSLGIQSKRPPFAGKGIALKGETIFVKITPSFLLAGD